MPAPIASILSNGRVVLTRDDGSVLSLSGAEAAAIAQLFDPGASATRAAAEHLARHGGLMHQNVESPADAALVGLIGARVV